MIQPPIGQSGWSRQAAVLLVLVQAASLALLEKGVWFGSLASLAAVLSLSKRLRIPPHQRPHGLWFCGLAVILALKHWYAPAKLPEQITYLNTPIAYELARFLILWQIVQLYVEHPRGHLPRGFVAAAMLSMVFASDVRLNPDTRELSSVLCLSFVAAFGCYAAAQRQTVGRGGVLPVVIGIVALTTVVAGGAAIAEVLRTHQHTLSNLLEGRSRELDSMRPGFSGQGRIGDIAGWQTSDADRIALTGVCESNPGYLRGCTFEEYWKSSWSALLKEEIIAPSRPLPGMLPHKRHATFVFGDVSPHSDLAWTRMELTPAPSAAGRLFLPLHTVALAAEDEYLALSPNRLIRRTTLINTPYIAARAEEPEQEILNDEIRQRLLGVPDSLHDVLEPLAAEIFADRETIDEKVEALKDWFRTRYRYHLRSVLTPSRRDRVELFLTEENSGHCELFASAGALLLRTAGIPSRYVTGYVMAERNKPGNYWVARRRDAHAWVEVYDDQTRSWRTVELTPKQGVPTPRESDTWRDWAEAQWHWLLSWHETVDAEGIAGTLVMVADRFLSRFGLLVMGGIAGGLWLLRRRRSRLTRADGEVSLPTHAELHALLVSVDRLARQMGFARSRGETLSQFAQRLRAGEHDELEICRQLAGWYEQYVEVRYGDADSAASRASLAVRAEQIRQVVQTRSRSHRHSRRLRKLTSSR